MLHCRDESEVFCLGIDKHRDCPKYVLQIHGAFGTDTSSYVDYLQVVLWTGLRRPCQVLIVQLSELGRRWGNENAQASAR